MYVYSTSGHSPFYALSTQMYLHIVPIKSAETEHWERFFEEHKQKTMLRTVSGQLSLFSHQSMLSYSQSSFNSLLWPNCHISKTTVKHLVWSTVQDSPTVRPSGSHDGGRAQDCSCFLPTDRRTRVSVISQQPIHRSTNQPSDSLNLFNSRLRTGHWCCSSK